MPTSTTGRVAIVGGGIAGFRLAEDLAAGNYPHPVTVFTDDSVEACNRPLLSKAFLSGDATRDELPLRFRHRDTYSVVTEAVQSINLGAETLTTASGETHEFDLVVIATGRQPRQLDVSIAGEVPQVAIYTAEDAERLASAATESARVHVVGSGMLALETASSLRSLGLTPTLETKTNLPLARIIGPRLAGDIASRIRSSGVHWVTSGEAATRPADHFVAATGAVFDARPVSLELGTHSSDDGIAVDENFRALADPHVLVIGDAAIWPDGRAHPHWFSALESAKRAARHLLGTAPESGWPTFVHSLWSDQWGARIQCFGAAFGDGELREHVLSESEDSCAVAFLDGDGVVQGIASVSPMGKPAAAIAHRPKLGKVLEAVPA